MLGLLVGLCFARVAHQLDSGVPTPTASALPAPTIPPSPPAIPATIQCASAGDFDITGTYEGAAVKTSFNGYSTRVRVDGVTSSSSYNCAPMGHGNVTFYTSFSNLSQNAYIISFRLRNVGSTSTMVDLQGNADIYLDGRDAAPKFPRGLLSTQVALRSQSSADPVPLSATRVHCGLGTTALCPVITGPSRRRLTSTESTRACAGPGRTSLFRAAEAFSGP